MVYVGLNAEQFEISNYCDVQQVANKIQVSVRTKNCVKLVTYILTDLNSSVRNKLYNTIKSHIENGFLDISEFAEYICGVQISIGNYKSDIKSKWKTMHTTYIDYIKFSSNVIQDADCVTAFGLARKVYKVDNNNVIVTPGGVIYAVNGDEEMYVGNRKGGKHEVTRCV